MGKLKGCHDGQWSANVNFKGFMADSAKGNWNVIQKIYGSGDLVVPMEDHECTCLFSGMPISTKSLKKVLNNLCSFNISKCARIAKMQR